MDVLPCALRGSYPVRETVDGPKAILSRVYSPGGRGASVPDRSADISRNGMKRAILEGMTRHARSSAVVAALLLGVTATAFCDEYYSDHGFSIDLPEGFEYIDGNGSTQFTFGLPDESVTVNIIVYPPSRFTDAKAGAAATAAKLSGSGTFAPLGFGGRDAAFGELSFGTEASERRGYGLFVNDAEGPRSASGAKPELYDLVVLSHARAADYEGYEDFVASAIDGFSLNVGRRAVPGPVGASARAEAGAGTLQTAAIPFGAATVHADWNPREGAVAQAIVEREYRVLSVYATSPELVEAAIARFYRMVFRDSAPSLDRLALEMSAAWETGAWAGTKPPTSLSGPDSTASAPATAPSGASNPRFGAPADPRGYASALLSWVQGFKYERDPEGSDVVNPISAAFESRGDCDSRALVMSILLRRENIRSILMISLQHEHALAAVDAPGTGARFPFRKINWLVAETTARVGIGMVDAAQADPASWIGIGFPD